MHENGEAAVTVNLGAEYDEGLIEACLASLKRAGATLLEQERSLAGSQDVKILKYRIDESDVEAVIETYLGFTLTGPPKILKDLQADIYSRLGHH